MNPTTALLLVSEANLSSQITRDLPPWVIEAQIAGPGQMDPRVRRLRPVVPQPAEATIPIQGATVKVVDNTPTAARKSNYLWGGYGEDRHGGANEKSGSPTNPP